MRTRCSPVLVLVFYSEIPVPQTATILWLHMPLSIGWLMRRSIDRKSTRLNSSHTEIYTLSLHAALPISVLVLVFYSEIPVPQTATILWLHMPLSIGWLMRRS